MKKLIVLLIVTIFVKVYTFAQEENNCTNNVSTNPNNPTNDNLPTNPPSPEFGERFLNQFDWFPISSSNNLNGYQTDNMPFLNQNGGEMLHTHNDGMNSNSNIYDFLKNEAWVDPDTDEMLYRPSYENGWELLAVNLGYFPNGETFASYNITNTYQESPFIILYNKYLGKIRLHGKVGDEWAVKNYWETIRVRLKIPGDQPNQNYNGMLRLVEGIDKSLDVPTTTWDYTAITEAINVNNQWFCAEFQVAFDPCVCDWPSTMEFSYELIQNDKLTLHGGGIEIEKEIIGGANDDELVHGDYLSNFKKHGNDNAEGGFVIYNEMQNLIDGYIEKLTDYKVELDAAQKHNAKVDRNLAILKWGSIAVKLGAAVITSGGSHSATFALMAADAPDLVISGDSIDVDKAFKQLEKILGTELNTFLGDSFKHVEEPKGPNRPTANFSEMYFEGNIQRSAERPGPTLITPGAYGNSIGGSIANPSRYPVYNEALGVFALLEKPKIKISETFSCNNIPGTTRNTLEKVVQLQIMDDLKYTFNSVLNIEKHEVEASFVTHSSYEKTQNLPSYNLENLKVKYTGVNSESIDINEGDEIKEDTDLIFNSIYIPIDALNRFVTENRMIFNDDGYYEFRCPSQLFNQIAENTNFMIDDIYLKLLINVTYEGEKSDGSPHEYTYMFTYKIDEGDIHWETENPLYPNLSNSASNLSHFHYDLELNGANFNGQDIDGCFLDNNIYLCKAENNVQLQGIFTVDTGYEVIIQAANEITELPETVRPPEMTLQIVPFFDMSNPMPPVDAGFINTFCSNNGAYSAKASNFPTIDDDSTNVIEEHLNDNFAFTIFPNPTGGSATASITLNQTAKGELFITDISGKKLSVVFDNQSLRGGENSYSLPTDTLAKGIYLVHLFVDGEHHVKRIVKQ